MIKQSVYIGLMALVASSAAAAPAGLLESKAPFSLQREGDSLAIPQLDPVPAHVGDSISAGRLAVAVRLLNGTSHYVGKNSTVLISDANTLVVEEGMILSSMGAGQRVMVDTVTVTGLPPAEGEAPSTVTVSKLGENFLEVATLSGAPVVVTVAPDDEQLGIVPAGDVMTFERMETGAWRVASPGVLQLQEGIENPDEDEDNDEAGLVPLRAGTGGGTIGTGTLIVGGGLLAGGVIVGTNPRIREAVGLDDGDDDDDDEDTPPPTRPRPSSPTAPPNDGEEPPPGNGDGNGEVEILD
jgi:hypothetical protein